MRAKITGGSNNYKVQTAELYSLSAYCHRYTHKIEMVIQNRMLFLWKNLLRIHCIHLHMSKWHSLLKVSHG